MCGGGGGRGELVGVAASSSDTCTSDRGSIGLLKNVVDRDKLVVLRNIKLEQLNSGYLTK